MQCMVGLSYIEEIRGVMILGGSISGVRKILPGFVNMDVVKLPGVDVVHDILDTPCPFKSEEFDCVLASHVLEHLLYQVNGKDALLVVMNELHRILTPGGMIEIRGPHPRIGIYYFNNPTHYRVITQWTFDGLVGEGHSSCLAFWSDIRFRRLTWTSETYAGVLLNSDILKGLIRRAPFLRKLVARPSELVIKLEK